MLHVPSMEGLGAGAWIAWLCPAPCARDLGDGRCLWLMCRSVPEQVDHEQADNCLGFLARTPRRFAARQLAGRVARADACMCRRDMPAWAPRWRATGARSERNAYLACNGALPEALEALAALASTAQRMARLLLLLAAPNV